MRTFIVMACALGVVVPAVAADKPPHAHQHGAAQLQVSLDGRILQIALETPADNLLGFEQAPKTDAQKKTVTRVEEQLQQPGQLFALPPAADCRAQPARVGMKLPPPGSREKHSEIEAEWRWECGKADALSHVDAGGLFKAFPRVKELRTQVVSARGQRTLVLRPSAPRLKLAS